MNISFTPANSRPNFQAHFSEDAQTKKVLREFAKDAPTMLYQAHLALKHNPVDDGIAVRKLLFGQYDIINTRTKRAVRIDTFENEPYGLLDAVRNRKALFDENVVVERDKYKALATDTVKLYKKAAMPPELPDLNNEIKELEAERLKLDIKLKPLYEQKSQLVEQQTNGVANAIMNDIFLL